MGGHHSKELDKAIDSGDVEAVTKILTEARTEHPDTGVEKLLAHKHNGLVPLAGAAWRGHDEVCRVLVSAWGADVDGVSKGGKTPLHVAAAEGKATTVATLLVLGADASVADADGATAAQAVCEDKGMEYARAEIQELLGGAIDPVAYLRMAEVFQAIKHGGLDKVRAAFSGDNALDINGHCKGGTPLTRAAQSKDPQMVALILELGADPSLPGFAGSTPLHLAATAADDAIIKILLDGGADPLARDVGLNSTGKTPLERMLQFQRHGVISALHRGGNQEASIALLEEAQRVAGEAADEAAAAAES